MKTEVWAHIPRYEGRYKASNLGNILSLKYRGNYGTEATLSLMRQSNGYMRVRLLNGKAELVHVLVAEAFIGPKPKGCQINHKNGIKTDNRPENLEWVTPSENCKHKFRIGRHCLKGENHNNRKLTNGDVLEIRRLRDAGVLLSEVAERFGINKGTASCIANRKDWKHLPEEQPQHN